MAEPTQEIAAARSVLEDNEPTAARVDIPAAVFALEELFEQLPDADVTVEPAIATPADSALLGIDAGEYDHATIASALDRDVAIGSVERFGTREHGPSYQVTWQGRARRLLRDAVDRGLTITAVWARDARWCFQLLAPDRTTLSRAHDAIAEAGYRPECKYVGDAGTEQPGEDDLTEQQREALIAAFENGYYEIPREITAADLATSLDISHQALSERFRRAHAHLVGATLRLQE